MSKLSISQLTRRNTYIAELEKDLPGMIKRDEISFLQWATISQKCNNHTHAKKVVDLPVTSKCSTA
jgi:hypothetical protein